MAPLSGSTWRIRLRAWQLRRRLMVIAGSRLAAALWGRCDGIHAPSAGGAASLKEIEHGR